MRRSVLLLAALLPGLTPPGSPAAAPPPRPAGPRTVEQLARDLRPSVVVITTRGRDGKTAGLGSGFVVADGLIATNQHVVGEGRAVAVELADGTRHDATAVHASDRKADLAVLRVAARGLVPLPLGDSARLRDGQAVVALGNPKGLRHSVVAGVVSGRRQLAGQSMIQVAIPIEPGNSGGPLVDSAGRVVGVMTIKSLVTANLGFAVGVDQLRALLRRPNPVPMSAWRTIGRLDPDDWHTRGGRWRQRAGRIIAEGAGAGVGARCLCLSQKPVPGAAFEVAVSVRLKDEAGAAGLVFHADGGDKHYGFYPSGGALRFVCFAGADVFSWKVLRQESSPHYRPGEWNALKVRVEKGRFRCFVNGRAVFEVEDGSFAEGKVGLAKFRDTVAEFRQFRVARELPDLPAPGGLLAKVGKLLDEPLGSPLRGDALKKLPGGTPATLAALREEARLLERRAARLRQVALALHQREVLGALAKALAGKEAEVDLLHAALLLARLDNDEVDVDAYRAEVARMAAKMMSRLPKGADEKAKLQELNRFLFREKGFHGSRGDYYHRSNSYLPEVIDDRQGLPITLSVLYIELARRLGLRVEGVGLPGHFVVRHVPAKGKPALIDVYEGGATMSRQDAAQKVRELAGRSLEEADLAAVPKSAIVVRMLHNLLNVASRERDAAGVLRYLDAIIAVKPDSASERGTRAGVRYQAGDRKGALEDLDWLLAKEPEGIDLDRVRQLRRFIERQGR